MLPKISAVRQQAPKVYFQHLPNLQDIPAYFGGGVKPLGNGLGLLEGASEETRGSGFLSAQSVAPARTDGTYSR